jgi:hypothetical protein
MDDGRTMDGSVGEAEQQRQTGRETDQRTPPPTGSTEAFRLQAAAADSCPVSIPGQRDGGGTFVIYCELGNRMRGGSTLVHAIEDAIAGLQWTHPLGPFTASAARTFLLKGCCKHHRRMAEAFFESRKLGF